ncbi:MAG: glycoside hydrolase family 15 protein [Bdellovibrionaceae bacterium]|nr:glycoside hydrolase family 15 protein [Pseudobdellovibrionaceae bacterium]
MGITQKLEQGPEQKLEDKKVNRRKNFQVMQKLRGFFAFILISSIINIARGMPVGPDISFPLKSSLVWDQKVKSQLKMLKNFSPQGASRGIVIASPSRHEPDYYFHWVRDAAISYDVALQIYSDSNDGGIRSSLRDFSFDYVYLNQRIQNDSRAMTGLGEPKFYVDGSPYGFRFSDWGRPQNDGPALRAINYVMLYQTVVRENWAERDRLLPLIYDSTYPSNALLKKDLEFVARHWRDTSVDLWEEVRGNHFFTLLVQRKALLMGADLAATLQDPGAAFYYRTEAEKIKVEIESLWNPQAGYIFASRFEGDAGRYRESRLDTAVLFGALAGDYVDGFMAPYDDRVLATLHRLREVFGSIYQINQNSTFGPALGRYPEDVYDGVSTSIGNPWFIGTQAGAEIFYRTYIHLKGVGRISINSVNLKFYQSLVKDSAWLHPGMSLSPKDGLFYKITDQLRIEGDKMLARTLYHGGEDGSLSEQMNRYSGYMQGANDLTWSHASYLSAYYWREMSFQR